MPHRPEARRRRRSARNPFLPYALCAVVLGGGIILRAVMPAPPEPTPDEATYTQYSAEFLRGGPAAQSRLLAQQAASDSLAVLPPPTRIGYLWLGSAFMWLTGSPSIHGLLVLAVLCSIGTLTLLCAIGIAAFDGWTAAIALVFLAVSPPDLAIARRAWADALFGLCGTAMLWAFLRATRAPKAWLWPAALQAIGTFGILVKEAGLLLVLLGSAGLAMLEWRRSRSWRPPLLMLAGGAASVLAAALILSLACGGVAPWWTALERTWRATATNLYVRDFQTGSPLYYVQGLAALQPVPFLLGFAGALLVAIRTPFLRGRWDRAGADVALSSVAWMVLLVTGAACLYTQKNVRFLSPIYAPVALLAAAVVRTGLVALRERLPAGAFRVAATGVVLLVLLSAVADLNRFTELFLRRGVTDLATPWFLARPGQGPR